MRLGAIRKWSIEELRRGGVESPRTCADWLIEHFAGVSRIELLSHSDWDVTHAVETAIRQAVERRIAGEPVQYIVGWTEFCGLKLVVSPSVLIPRPETEILVEAVLEATRDFPGCRILDMGTGSGCIALSVKSKRPQGHIVACDVSDAALRVASANAQRLRLHVGFRRADMEDADSVLLCGSEFDVMVSNPPYIPQWEVGNLPEEIVAFEPRAALEAGEDPLRFYRALLSRATERLADGGWLIAEIHADYSKEVASLAAARGFGAIEIRLDLAALPRMLVARWGRSP